jgi:choline transport protein
MRADPKLAVIGTGLGAIPLGSSTAFLDLTGSFIILSTVSYAIPFLGNVLTKRENFPKGPFSLGKFGTPVNLTAVLLITLFNIFYCFRECAPGFLSNLGLFFLLLFLRFADRRT